MSRVEGGPVGWSGTPLDRQNLGTWLKEGDQACSIGDPARLEAVLVIDQADIPFVREGQKVSLLLDALAGRTIPGQIDEVSQGNLKISSRKLSTKHGGQLDTRSDPETGQERPASPAYQASVLLDNSDRVLRLDFKGEAHINVGSETLFAKSWRYLAKTFYFTL